MRTLNSRNPNIIYYSIILVECVLACARPDRPPDLCRVCMVTAGRDVNAQIPCLWARCYFIRWCLKFQILSYVHL